MSKQSPYNISISEGGRFVRYEWEANYLTDEQLETVRRHVETLQAENAKLRELVRDMHKALFSLNLDHCQACPREDACVFMHKSFDCGECTFERDMRELGVEVDA